MRERSSTSVAHTTSESMLNPRAARIPDTRDRTPGSFCTRQFRVCRVNGWCEGGGAGADRKKSQKRVSGLGQVGAELEAGAMSPRRGRDSLL